MRNFLFVLGSSRQGGNSEFLARRAAEHLPEDARQRWIWLEDLPLDPFRDTRQDRVPHPEPVGAERTLLDATLEATDIVLVSPLYWYSVSATMKRYLDHWSGWMHLPGRRFKGTMSEKTMWVVSTADEHDMSDSLVGTLHKSATYLKMRWGGVLLGHGHHPGEVITDEAAMADAEIFFQGVHARS